MTWYRYSALASLVACAVLLLPHLFRIIRSGPPRDFSRPARGTGGAIRYAFWNGMNPAKKESAYLHLPTYIAGVLYHTGTFLSMLLFVVLLSGRAPGRVAASILAAVLAVSAICGAGIFVKRITVRKLNALSNPDDYISNLLVTVFQVLTLGTILEPPGGPLYYLWISALLLYFPLGKLKHALYFFAARYHLGFFYGRRGVWPERRL